MLFYAFFCHYYWKCSKYSSTPLRFPYFHLRKFKNHRSLLWHELKYKQKYIYSRLQGFFCKEVNYFWRFIIISYCKVWSVSQYRKQFHFEDIIYLTSCLHLINKYLHCRHTISLVKHVFRYDDIGISRIITIIQLNK